MELKELLGDSYKEGMTLDEVSEALKGIELPKDQSGEIEKLRESLSKSNSEAADWKKQFRATQDEATRKAAEVEESTKKLQEELKKTNAPIGIREQKLADYVGDLTGLSFPVVVDPTLLAGRQVFEEIESDPV